MTKATSDKGQLVCRGDTMPRPELPAPTMRFRRLAWLRFQRALDPLAPPKPLPTQRPR